MMRQVPWESWQQWHHVRCCFFSNSPAQISEALDRVSGCTMVLRILAVSFLPRLLLYIDIYGECGIRCRTCSFGCFVVVLGRFLVRIRYFGVK